MERKIIAGLILLAFVLLVGFVFSINDDGPAKQHFFDVAKQKENDFKIFDQSDNLLPVLKKFQDIGSGAALAYDSADGRFYIIQESYGERDFEIYAGVTKTIVNSTPGINSPYINSKDYPFVFLDCYDGIGADYVVPKDVWDSGADLKLNNIITTCKNVGGKDFDYSITEAPEFSSFLDALRKTNTVGYPFVEEQEPAKPEPKEPSDVCSSITGCMVKIDNKLLEIFE